MEPLEKLDDDRSVFEPIITKRNQNATPRTIELTNGFP